MSPEFELARQKLAASPDDEGQGDAASDEFEERRLDDRKEMPSTSFTVAEDEERCCDSKAGGPILMTWRQFYGSVRPNSCCNAHARCLDVIDSKLGLWRWVNFAVWSVTIWMSIWFFPLVDSKRDMDNVRTDLRSLTIWTGILQFVYLGSLAAITSFVRHGQQPSEDSENSEDSRCRKAEDVEVPWFAHAIRAVGCAVHPTVWLIWVFYYVLVLMGSEKIKGVDSVLCHGFNVVPLLLEALFANQEFPWKSQYWSISYGLIFCTFSYVHASLDPGVEMYNFNWYENPAETYKIVAMAFVCLAIFYVVLHFTAYNAQIATRTEIDDGQLNYPEVRRATVEDWNNFFAVCKRQSLQEVFVRIRIALFATWGFLWLLGWILALALKENRAMYLGPPFAPVSHWNDVLLLVYFGSSAFATVHATIAPDLNEPAPWYARVGMILGTLTPTSCVAVSIGVLILLLSGTIKHSYPTCIFSNGVNIILIMIDYIVANQTVRMTLIFVPLAYLSFAGGLAWLICTVSKDTKIYSIDWGSKDDINKIAFTAYIAIILVLFVHTVLSLTNWSEIPSTDSSETWGIVDEEISDWRPSLGRQREEITAAADAGRLCLKSTADLL